MSSLQFFLLRILNDLSVQTSQAVKLRALSLEPLLERCKDNGFVIALLNQEKQIDSGDFKTLLVEIVGSGAGTAQINLLLDLVRVHGPLSIPACQRLSVVFPSSGEKTQLQIARLLVDQIETGPSVFYF
jgi:hypothetical protein